METLDPNDSYWIRLDLAQVDETSNKTQDSQNSTTDMNGKIEIEYIQLKQICRSLGLYWEHLDIILRHTYSGVDNLNGSWIRTKDNTIIRIVPESSLTVKAHLPTEEQSYSLNKSVLQINRDNQEYQGYYDNIE